MLLFNFKYYHQTHNKDDSHYWKCRVAGCSSSATMKDEHVLKLNGKKITGNLDLDLVKQSHNHQPLEDLDIAVTKVCIS